MPKLHHTLVADITNSSCANKVHITSINLNIADYIETAFQNNFNIDELFLEGLETWGITKIMAGLTENSNNSIRRLRLKNIYHLDVIGNWLNSKTSRVLHVDLEGRIGDIHPATLIRLLNNLSLSSVKSVIFGNKFIKILHSQPSQADNNDDSSMQCDDQLSTDSSSSVDSLPITAQQDKSSMQSEKKAAERDCQVELVSPRTQFVEHSIISSMFFYPGLARRVAEENPALALKAGI